MNAYDQKARFDKVTKTQAERAALAAAYAYARALRRVERRADTPAYHEAKSRLLTAAAELIDYLED